MIRFFVFIIIFFALVSCGEVELVLKDAKDINPYKNNTLLVLDNTVLPNVAQEFISVIGSQSKYKYILKVDLLEKKENMLVKKNQVAEKIDYEITINYVLLNSNRSCELESQKIITRFSFVPKSFGYNFGTDSSFNNLYQNTIRKNIDKFISLNTYKKIDECDK
tara:strand:- start:2392 stop:2883 length:492 start_codon:yes stop_codon:yes gene_type:complete